MDNHNQRNLILAVVLTALVLFGWDAAIRYIYPDSGKPAPVASASANAGGAAADPQRSDKPTREGGLTNPADIALEAKDIKSALAAPTRVAIAAPGLSGSINLVGGVVDDLTLNRHTAALDQASGAQRLFSPAGTPAQQFAQFGWVGENIVLPTATTVWTAPAGARLTPKTPVTLTANNGARDSAITPAP